MELISIKRKSPTNNFVSDLLDCLNGYTPFTFYAANDQCVKQRMNQLGFPEFIKENNSVFVPYEAGTGKYDDFFWSDWK